VVQKSEPGHGISNPASVRQRREFEKTEFVLKFDTSSGCATFSPARRRKISVNLRNLRITTS
jgi:hypothetical protein